MDVALETAGIWRLLKEQDEVVVAEDVESDYSGEFGFEAVIVVKYEGQQTQDQQVGGRQEDEEEEAAYYE